jgi:hypothetical protein
MPGFGHVGIGGSVGETNPADTVAFALVRNRLLTPFVMTDHAGFVVIYALIRRAAAEVRKCGLLPVTYFGPSFPESGARALRRGRLDYEASSAPGATMAMIAPFWLGVRWKRRIVERDLVRSNTSNANWEGRIDHAKNWARSGRRGEGGGSRGNWTQ